MSYIISLPYDPRNVHLESQRIVWAKEHCSSYQGAEVKLPYTIGCATVDYRFGDDKHATIFALRWS